MLMTKNVVEVIFMIRVGGDPRKFSLRESSSCGLDTRPIIVPIITLSNAGFGAEPVD